MSQNHSDELTARARAFLQAMKPEKSGTVWERARMQAGDEPAKPSGERLPMAPIRSAIEGPRTPDKINLGVMAPDREAIRRLVEARRAAVIEQARSMPDSNRFLAKHYPLDLDEFCVFAAKHSQLVREYESERGLITFDSNNPGLIGLLNLPWSTEFTPDYPGWIKYLLTIAPAFENEVMKLRGSSQLPEEHRRLNTLIVAPIGWGKSELMKALAYHYTQDNSAAVVVLDPGSDMVRQIARWPELVRDDRAILIEPNLQRGLTVSFNPLDGSWIDDDETRKLVASDWAHVLGDLTNDLSPNMLNMAQSCIHVLLAFPGGATFHDLKLLLIPRTKRRGIIEPPRDNRHDELMRFAENYPLPYLKHYFTYDFTSPSAESTRSALSNRVGTLLSLAYVEAMFCGPPTFDFEKAIRERKFILFNLGRFGRQGSITVGKLLVAWLGAIGRRRELPGSERVPTHIFIDEATTLASPAMLENLNQLRKFGVHQTLAQQVGGDGFDAKAKKVLKTNTRCKFYAGPLDGIGDVLDLDERADELPKVGAGQFYVQWPGREGLGRLAVSDGLVDAKHTAPDAILRQAEARMIKNYYRKADDFTRPAMVFDEAPSLLAAVDRKAAALSDLPAPTFVPRARIHEPELELPPDPPEIDEAEPSPPPSPAAAPQRATSPAAKARRKKDEN